MVGLESPVVAPWTQDINPLTSCFLILFFFSFKFLIIAESWTGAKKKHTPTLSQSQLILKEKEMLATIVQARVSVPSRESHFCFCIFVSVFFVDYFFLSFFFLSFFLSF